MGADIRWEIGAKGYLSIQLQSRPIWYQIDSGWWSAIYTVAGGGILMVMVL